MENNNNFKRERVRPTFPKKAVVTGGMPYGNKELHFAHFGGYMVHADVFARFLRDRLGKDNVVFVSGTDCYGSPAIESYRKLKDEGKINDENVAEFVKRNHEIQKDTYETFEIMHNLFGASGIGRAGEIHNETSKEFVEKLYNNKTLSKLGSFQFFDKKYNCLLNGRQVIGKCPIENCQSEKGYADECDLGHQYSPIELIDPVSTLSHEKPELVKIENWYFNLQNYLDILSQWVDNISKDKSTRSFMIKEIKEFFKKPEIYIKKDQLEKFEEVKNNIPNFHVKEENSNASSLTIFFDKLEDREKACEVLTQNQIRYRTGKTLVPFRLSGDIEWGVPFPTLERLENQTFYVWPESLWAPISFTKTYLESIGKDENEWKKYWASKDAEIYQFIGEDNLYFYGPAQQAIWLATQGENPTLDPSEGQLRNTHIIPSKHVLYLNVKASSSGAFKPPMARELLNYYTPEQLRMHFLGMNLGNNNVSFMPKPLNPNAKPEEADPVLKEGNLLTNVFNRVLRSVFYTAQNELDGIVPVREISEKIKEECKNTILNYEQFMADKKFHQVINNVDVFVRNINKYFVKEIREADTKEKIATLIANTLEYIKTATYLLHPIAPKGTENVAKYIGFNDKMFNWDYIFEDLYFFFDVKENHKLMQLKEKEDFFKKHPSQLIEEE
ncbi:MAG: class I tRNA ligase family protein [Clostridia bacterium]|nr:class I tRNA ligase family protein [Clostridia bacterium]